MFDSPIMEQVTDFSSISVQERRWFMVACSCIGWLANTCRIDLKLAHSPVAQCRHVVLC